MPAFSESQKAGLPEVEQAPQNFVLQATCFEASHPERVEGCQVVISVISMPPAFRVFTTDGLHAHEKRCLCRSLGLSP